MRRLLAATLAGEWAAGSISKGLAKAVVHVIVIILRIRRQRRERERRRKSRVARKYQTTFTKLANNSHGRFEKRSWFHGVAESHTIIMMLSTGSFEGIV